MCCSMLQAKCPDFSGIFRNLGLRFYFNSGAQIHHVLFLVGRKNHPSVLFCDCRWSYRTAATSQRRKERNRQQTEHLGLDNDLKEVGEIRLRLQSVTYCSSCAHLLLPLLASNIVFRPTVSPVCEILVNISLSIFHCHLAAISSSST